MFTCRALDESTWPAFAELVERNGGVFGGCWCMGFHPEGVGKQSTAALNRERKLNRVRSGTTHAALVFDGDECVGWCQFGVPDELPRIKSRAAYEKGQSEPPDWRIACCYVGRGQRRRGVATAGLAGALDLIAQLGGGTVEGYPRRRRVGARRLPLQRGPVDLREARLHQGPQDRKAPLGRQPGRRASRHHR
jgi:hypothetical protein